MVITREQIEKIKTEASHSDVQEGLVSMIPNEVVSLCDLALKSLEADERARQAVQAALEAAATIADAWVTPEQRLSRSTELQEETLAILDRLEKQNKRK